MELLIANVLYVAYRLIITASIVKFFNRYVNYYVAVLIAAQISFAYDYFIFSSYFTNSENFAILEFIKSNVLYTMRVIAAWWLIKQIWNHIGNYWVSVFIGAEITFICDYYIFANLLRG